jgi:hypothetical protein
MKNLLKTLLVIFFVIWLKGRFGVVFCDKYEQGNYKTIAYQNGAIIAVIDNTQIVEITERGTK